MSITLKILGALLILCGVIVTVKPGLFGAQAENLSGYDLTEKRVKWGILIGVGAFLIFFQLWGNWGATIWALLAALTIGIIIARSAGLVIDGISAKQMLWLGIEIALAAIFSWLYWRQLH